MRRSAVSALVLCAAGLAPLGARAQTPAPNPFDATTGGDALAPTIDPVGQPAPGPPRRPDPHALGAIRANRPSGAGFRQERQDHPAGDRHVDRQYGEAAPGSAVAAPARTYARSQKPIGRSEQTLPGPIAPVPAVFGPTVAVLPAPPPLRHALPDPDPFAPIGYSVGSFRMTPYVEQSLGYDSNPDQIATKVRPSGFSRTEGGFDLSSLWSSNQLKATMHAGYDAFFSNPDANRPDANGVVDYRLDATRDLTFDTEGRFAITTQRPGSPEVNAAVVDRPLVTSYGTTLGASDTLGRFTLGLHGLFDRVSYENGRLSDGTVVILDDQTYNDYGLVARVDYELLPTIKPFVQVTVDTRKHDSRLDQSGYARDSNGIIGQVGSTFEISHLLTGSLSAGYGDRSYQDRRLRDLDGPVIDASLSYAITPLTTLGFTANTSFNETDVVGSSGAETRSFAVQASHALLRNLTLTAIAGYSNTDYVGSTIVENTYSGTLKASYSLSRSIVLDASYNHATLKSSDPSSSFTQDVVMLGMRLQH